MNLIFAVFTVILCHLTEITFYFNVKFSFNFGFVINLIFS